MNTPTIKSSTSLRQFIVNALKPYKFHVFFMAFTALYWAVNNSVTPYVLKNIIDTVVAFKGNRVDIWSAVQTSVFIYLALWIGISINFRLLDWVKMKLYPSLRRDLMNNMFDYLIGHSYRYFQNNFAGSLSNKIGDMHSGVISILNTLDDSFAQLLGLIVATIMMLLVHPIFGLILFVWVLCFLAITYYYFYPIQNLSHAFSRSRTKVFGRWVDSISNITNLRLFSRSRFESQRIGESVTEAINQDRAMEWVIIKMRIFWT